MRLIVMRARMTQIRENIRKAELSGWRSLTMRLINNNVAKKLYVHPDYYNINICATNINVGYICVTVLHNSVLTTKCRRRSEYCRLWVMEFVVIYIRVVDGTNYHYHKQYVHRDVKCPCLISMIRRLYFFLSFSWSLYFKRKCAV